MKDAVKKLLADLKAKKPNDRSEKDRYTAILITDTEKLLALATYIESKFGA